MGRFINQFRYHAKRTIAIILLGCAVAFQIANFILGIIDISIVGLGSFSFIWNFVILTICYVRMLRGNMQDNAKAIFGVLLFVALSTVSLIFDVINSVITLGLSSGGIDLIVQLITFVVTAAELTLAILTSINIRKMVYGVSKMSLRGFKVLYGFFFGLLILAQSFFIVMMFIGLGSAINITGILLLLLSPISELFATAGAWVTLSRIE